MGWTFDQEIYSTMVEFAEQVRRVEDEKKPVIAQKEEFRKIHGQYNSIYAAKYGINDRSVEERLEPKDLERMMHLIRAEAGQIRRPGLFGAGGLKREEYYNVTNRLNLVESNLDRILRECEETVSAYSDQLRERLKRYDKVYVAARQSLEKMDSLASYEIISDVDTLHFPIASISIERPVNTDLDKIFSESALSFSHKGKIFFPVFTSLKSLESCCIRYEDNEQLEYVYEWIRGLNKQMLLCFPPYHYNLVYLDALNNAGGLREFLNAQNLYQDYVEDIVPQLYDNRLDLIKVARDGESIHSQLQQLEEYMGRVTDLLQGLPDAETYNKSHTEQIPVRIVIMEGMESYLGDSAVRKLLANGKRCGISTVLLLSSKVMNNSSRSDWGQEMPAMFQNCVHIQFREKTASLLYGETEYPITLWGLKNNQRAFVESLNKVLGTKKQVDNGFAACFPDEFKWGTYVSTNINQDGNAEGKILLPCAVNSRGQIVDIELGSAEFAHGLISGGTGSGKSTLLHMIINSVVMNYHPLDVEIWLIDYKQTEMSVYIKDRPPHIKFIGIERNEEFTFSMIDLISEEYQRRMRLFADAGVRNIDIYKQKFGVNSMPRLLIIIDEFHVMAQQAYENHEYSERLENILAEGRAMGVVCLFADQTVSVGLKGLTEKGKKQMRQRLAMANDKEEMATTLDMRVSDADTAMQTGEVRRKKMVSKRQPDGEYVREYELELDKVIYINDQQRMDVTRRAQGLYGEGEKPVIVDGTVQAYVDWETAAEYENRFNDDRERIFLHLGKPSNFEPCFALSLVKDYGQNLICVHERNDLKGQVVIHLIESFLRKDHCKIYVMADQNDGLYLYLKRRLEKLGKMHSNLVTVCRMPGICSRIINLCDELEERRKREGAEDIMVIWLGLESILREFEYYDELPSEKRHMSAKNQKMQKLEEDIESRMSALFAGFESVSQPAAEYEEEELYDLRDQVEQLVREGAKRGIFQSVFMSNLLAVKSSKKIRLEQFTYKMSGFLNRDNAIEFYGSFRFMNGMSEKEDNNSYVCYDGRRARFFIPYKIKEMEEYGI